MPQLQHALIFCLAALPFSSTAHSGGLPVRKMRQQWNGSWVASKSFNSMLGYDDRSRLDAAVDHPTGFRLELNGQVGAAPSDESLKRMESIISRHLNHEVVSQGTWETTFEVDPGIGSTCVITEYEGSTYVWVEAPYIGIYGGRVSFIRGIDAAHDLMIIDFNPTMEMRTNSERTPDTVVFRRAVPVSKSDTAESTATGES